MTADRVARFSSQGRYFSYLTELYKRLYFLAFQLVLLENVFTAKQYFYSGDSLTWPDHISLLQHKRKKGSLAT